MDVVVSAVGAGAVAQKRQRVREDARWRMLTRQYPFSPAIHPVHDCVARELRELSKYEIAVQGDDFADKDDEHTNHESRNYLLAAGVVASLDWSIRDTLRDEGRERTEERLRAEPYIGKFRASQIAELAQDGTCEALVSFRRNERPLDSRGERRAAVTSGAHAKRALKEVLGIGPLRARKLYHHECLDEKTGTRLAAAVTSVDELRACPPEERAKLRSSRAGASFEFGLAHYEELKAPVCKLEALEMIEAVRRIVREQHSKRAGEVLDCAGDACSCCWHVCFVGGARRCGAHGHDADLLVWHREADSSWGPAADECVLVPLVRELEAEGHVLRAAESWQMLNAQHRKREPHPGRTTRSHRYRTNSRGDVTEHGHHNLQSDYHDRCFAVWRTAEAKHRRVDIVVCTCPEELPFALLSWTGARTLNRLMRLQAESLGLRLTAHGLIARPTVGAVGVLVAIDTRPGASCAEVLVRPGQPVPYEHLASEEAIIRVLAHGTEDFEGLYDPRNRNLP